MALDHPLDCVCLELAESKPQEVKATKRMTHSRVSIPPTPHGIFDNDILVIGLRGLQE